MREEQNKTNFSFPVVESVLGAYKMIGYDFIQTCNVHMSVARRFR